MRVTWLMVFNCVFLYVFNIFSEEGHIWGFRVNFWKHQQNKKQTFFFSLTIESIYFFTFPWHLGRLWQMGCVLFLVQWSKTKNEQQKVIEKVVVRKSTWAYETKMSQLLNRLIEIYKINFNVCVNLVRNVDAHFTHSTDTSFVRYLKWNTRLTNVFILNKNTSLHTSSFW